MKVAFKLFYDGEAHRGFTGGEGSVEWHVRKAISRFIRDFRLSKASRTDPGVSAIENVISVEYDEGPLINTRMLNSELPTSIRAWAWAIPPEGFNARKAVARKYVYTAIWRGEDIDIMRKGAGLFIGTHDLANFQVREKGVPTVVTIYGIDVRRKGELIIFEFVGKGFRNKMIRKIVNALLMLGRGALGLDELRDLIDKKIERPIPPAPSEGLCLVRVDYGDLEPKWNIDEEALTQVMRYLVEKVLSLKTRLYVYTGILDSLGSLHYY